MPMMDMSSALTNPITMDQFSANRRTQSVDNFGISSTANVISTPLYGVVYPSNENDLKRLPDTQVQSKAITVITRFALRGESHTSGSEFQPDIVVWPLVNGNSYLVRDVLDWSQYAAGFINAICTSINLVDQPPTTE